MAVDTTWIVERSRGLGFDLCGVVRPEAFPELAQFGEWLELGYGGEMAYLQDERRRSPGLVMEDLRSVIVCTLNYNTAFPCSTTAAGSRTGDGEPRGWVSRYAWGDDYHEVLWGKLNTLVAAMKEEIPEPFAARAYADTGPVAERVFAKHAGLGWIGKNTLLLNEKVGSWLFLGVIFTSLELEPSLGPAEAAPPDLCGHCRQCLDACPTEALIEPYVMDARRCISYLTIELRGAIPEEFREAMGWQVYGCDICQDVCPFNGHAPVTELKAFQPRKLAKRTLLEPELEWLAGMSEEEFRDAFRGSAMKRAKWAGLVRNACIAIGNSGIRKGVAGYERIVRLLKGLRESENAGVKESARWALSRIEGDGGKRDSSLRGLRSE
jgi:epoxyqueuosine reductase